MKLIRLEKPTIVVISVLFAMATLDFFSRVVIWSDNSVSSKAWEKVQVPPPTRSPEIILQQLSQWIPLDLSGSTSSAAVPGKLFLKAVFVRRQGSRALLALEGPDGQVTRHITVARDDEIEGWRVVDIQSRKVIIERGVSNLELELFKNEAETVGGK